MEQEVSFREKKETTGKSNGGKTGEKRREERRGRGGKRRGLGLADGFFVGLLEQLFWSMSESVVGRVARSVP